MAIIACPSCAKPISDKHQQCPHCKINLTQLGKEDREHLAAKSRLQKKQNLMNQSFIALVVFLAGFLILYTRTPEADSFEMLLCQASIAVGFVWYLVNRIRLIFLKKK